MKKILGLDLGTASIGWALINEGDNPEILDMGVRIIPMDNTIKADFEKGNPNAESNNAKRTKYRSIRRGMMRYKLRRYTLVEQLQNLGININDELFRLSPLALYELRSKAVNQQITIEEFGRVLFHLNQKRGYKSSRKVDKADQKETEYVQAIIGREAELNGKTIGQYFYEKIKTDFEEKGMVTYRIKEKVFFRKIYIDEFNKIWACQSKFYPELLTEENKIKFRDKIIFHQRPLKSQKGLISVCGFEGKFYKDQKGKEIFNGPKVAPKSSPIFQVCKIWETINNISLKVRQSEADLYVPYKLNIEEKKKIFDYLDTNDKLSLNELLTILKLNKNNTQANALIAKKGLQGNITKTNILKILGHEYAALMQFNIVNEEYEHIDKNTGEITKRLRVNAAIEREPYYQLWHCLYSIADDDLLVKTLIHKFGINDEKAATLAKKDFTTGAYGNKSVKAMRLILPYLQQGLTYDKACLMAGYNHSDSLTADENEQRTLKEKLTLLSKGELRQPVVEKVLNQMINVVNAIMDKHGRPDEIRIELARELKQSRDERKEAFDRIDETEKKHKAIKKLLEESPEFRIKKVSRRDIERYKLWEEFDGVSPYEPNKKISLKELYSGLYDIEHIIPRSVMFDDSFSNKTICPRHLNSGENAKNKLLGLEFMKSRNHDQYTAYIQCIESNKKISRTKRNKLLLNDKDLTPDFIARQLNETQYITRKAREILTDVCREVNVTSGKITAHLRNIWGWNDILMHWHLPKYRENNLTIVETYQTNGQNREREIIKGWEKRDDHRHHAIDALSVACTTRAIVQRINSLNAQHTREEMFAETANDVYKEKLSLLDKYLLHVRPFDTSAVTKTVNNILVSVKPGKKAAVKGIRVVKKHGKKTIVQSNIIVPRGPLSEETVYGKIKKAERCYDFEKVFKEPALIVKKPIKQIILERLAENDNNIKEAVKSLKKKPLLYKDAPLTFVTMYVEDYVVKYPLASIEQKDLKYIVDKKINDILSSHLSKYNNKHTEAFKNIDENPVYFNADKKIKIKSVKLFTGLKAVNAVKVQDTRNKIEYSKYLKPGNNHHIGIYYDASNKLYEIPVTFWAATERMRYGINAIIDNPKEIWDVILHKELELPAAIIQDLPHDDWTLKYTLQQNDTFIFNMSQAAIVECINNGDFTTISPNLYRVQNISEGDYKFRHHLETRVDDKYEDIKNESLSIAIGKMIRITSLSKLNGIKVKINNIGLLSLP